MAVTSDTPGVKITHIMADGSVRDSVKGYLKSADQLPELAQRMICLMVKRGHEIYAAQTEEGKAALLAALRAEDAKIKADLQSTAQTEE